MPIVRNIIKDAKGTPLQNVVVTIDVGIFNGSGVFSLPQGFSDIGTDYSSDYSINAAASLNTDGAGAWQCTLEANSNIINPTNSVYRIQETYGGTTRTYYIIVPASGGPYWVGEILDLIHTPSTSGTTSTFAALTDVNMFAVSDKDFIRYDASTGKYIPDYIASGTPDVGLAPLWTGTESVWSPVVTPSDINALTSPPANQAGLRALGFGATDAMPGNTVISASTSVSQLTDVYLIDRQSGDQILDDGAGHYINVPYSVWSDPVAMAAFNAGSGGTQLLAITDTTIPKCTQSLGYSFQLTAVGGRTSYTWSATGLPTDFSLSSSGLLTCPSGVSHPPATGNTNATFTVTDSLLRQAQVVLQIRVVALASPMAFTAPSLPNAQVGQPYSFDISGYVSGGIPPYTFTSSSLPNKHISLSSTGILSGTPVAGDAGPLTVAITATDSDTSNPPVTPTVKNSSTTLTIDASASPNILNNAFATTPKVNGWEPLAQIDTSTQSVPSTGTIVHVRPVESLIPGVNNATFGNDTTGTGTSGNPYATIGRAMTALASTTGTIIGHDGTYRETITNWPTNTSANRSVTLTSAAGEWMQFKGSDIVTGWQAITLNNSTVWQKTGWDMSKFNRKHTYGYATTVKQASTLNQTASTMQLVSTNGASPYVAYPTSGNIAIKHGSTYYFVDYTGKVGGTYADTNGRALSFWTGAQTMVITSNDSWATSGTFAVAASGGTANFTYTSVSQVGSVVTFSGVTKTVGTATWTLSTNAVVTSYNGLKGCTIPSGSVTLTVGDVAGNGDFGGNASDPGFGWFDEIVDPATNVNSGYPDMVFIDGEPLRFTTNLTGVIGGQGLKVFWVDMTKTDSSAILYISEDPTNKVVEASTRAGFCMLPKTNGTNLIQGAGFAHYAGQYNFNFLTNNATNMHGATIVNANSTATNVTLRNCFFIHNGKHVDLQVGTCLTDNCVMLYAGANGGHSNNNINRVQSSRIQYSNNRKFKIQPQPYAQIGAWKSANMTQSTWVNNIVTDNYCNGIWHDVYSKNTIFANNLCERNQAFGLNCENSQTSVFINNICVDNYWSGIKVADGSDTAADSGALIYNNTVTGNGSTPYAAYLASEIFLLEINGNFTFLMKDTELFNNLIVCKNSTLGSLNLMDQAAPSGTTTGAGILSKGHNSNMWVRLNGFTNQPLAKWAVPSTGGQTITSFATLQGMDGTNENKSTISDGLLITDIFVSPSSENYRISPGFSSLATLPVTTALSSVLIARLGISAYTPTTVGANDALAAIINTAFGISRTTLPALT